MRCGHQKYYLRTPAISQAFSYRRRPPPLNAPFHDGQERARMQARHYAGHTGHPPTVEGIDSRRVTRTKSWLSPKASHPDDGRQLTFRPLSSSRHANTDSQLISI